ncbi:MAG: hypothetical protein LBL01_04175 [Bifidobacteriaceae bacterium]|jgi:trehalose 6-phosphate phosphatase|nr:hypothetical protein [Bifidobacteriaceae bacterium]
MNAAWGTVIAPLVAAKRLVVALDFDGTLAPLVPNPDDARVLPEAAAALRRIAAAPGVVLALVSGRPAADLARLALPPDGTVLIGSHGAEHGRAAGGGVELEPVELSPARRARLARVRAALEALAAEAPTDKPALPPSGSPRDASAARSDGERSRGVNSSGSPRDVSAARSDGERSRGVSHSGAWVEAKPFAAVFHTRPMADRAAAAALEERAKAVGAKLGGHVLPGKMVVEVAVLPSGKAGALSRLKAAAGADRMVFAGDDVTDELALKTIKPPDLGVKVGPGKSAAALRLAGPPQLARFLTALADALDTPRDQ